MTRKPLARFWRALDEIPEATTDRREWSVLLEDDWPSAAIYLTETGRLAREIACPSPGGDGCPRKVVHHENGKVEAVCGNRPSECETVDLAQDDIMELALDRRKLAAAIGRMLNATSEPRPEDGRAVCFVGSHSIAAGIGIPIFLMIPGPHASDSWNLLSSVGRRTAAIAVPTPQSLSGSAQAVLEAQGHTILALGEVAGVDAKHRLVSFRSPESLLGELRSRLLVEQESPKSAWRLPADARWEELDLDFTADEVAIVRFRGQFKRFEPEHLQMKDRRNGRPTEQWTLLMVLAAYKGRIGWMDSAAKTAIRKQKQELARKLRVAFGIDSDPIVWDRRARVYRTRFSIRGIMPNRSHTADRG